MAVDGMGGIERAKSFGNLMAAGVLFAGSVGLFASGLAAVIGTVASVVCLAGFWRAGVAQQVAEINHRCAVESAWLAENAANATSVEPDIDLSIPDKSFVASLAKRRLGGRGR